MKTTTKTKGLAWLLSLMMLVALMPGLAFAEGEQPDGITFTASVDGVNLDVGTAIENGYKGGYPETTVDLYSLTIPIGTEAVDLQFHRGDSAANCLAYNYAGTGGDPVVAGAYLSGSVDDTTIGVQQYRAAIDSDSVDYNTGSAIPADGFFDYIQVQNLYNTDWSGGELFYAITFRYDVFNAFIKGQAISKITKTEKGFTPYNIYDPTTWEPMAGEPVPLYMVTVPEGTESVELEFPEESLAYNYTADGKTWLAGEYENGGKTGKKTVTVELDANGDGEMDCIQVQTPYDDSKSSTVQYAITFDGVELDKPAPTEVTEEDAGNILHNIAATYAHNGAAGQDQAPWITADMMAYEKAFPASENKLSEDQKQAMVDESIAVLEKDSLTVGDAAKYILALTSMGVDPSRLTTSTGKTLDGRGKLDALAFDAEGKATDSAKNGYTIPYVILAYRQFDDASNQLESLKNAALEKEVKDVWMSTTWGVDGMTPMMLALAPLYHSEEAAGAALDEAVASVKAAQEKSGSLGTFVNPSTDGLAAAGFAALGIDPATVTYKGYPEAANLLEGLVSQADPDKSSFGGGNSFYTEQGFRGLLAASQVSDGNPYQIYDFSGQELKPAAASKGNVRFHVVPETGKVEVKNASGEVVDPADDGGLYNLGEGTYDYSVTCSGYQSKTGTITVTQEDLSAYRKLEENVSLQREPSADSNTVDVTVQVLVHDGKTCENSVTYKNEPDQFTSLLKTETYKATLAKNEGTARDALVEALDDSGITYEEVSNGYFPTIGEYTEFGHGTNSGWLYMVNGKAGTSAMKDVTFSQDGTLTLFYTDDYSRDYGSENWGGGGSGGGNDDSDDPSDQPGPEGYYDDTKGHWAEEAIDSITERGLMNGVAERKFAPDMTLSRAMFVTMLWRLEGEPYEEGTAQAGMNYSDVDGDDWYYKAVLWGVKNDIVKGTSDTTFSPDASLTREQMATFLYRYKNGDGRLEMEEDPSASPQNDISAIGSYTDADQVSSWAKEAVTWAIASGIINGVSEKKLAPQGTATRAQAATILLRYIDKHSL